jgi:glycosyltransferase involved in cell wall biosynthesis
VTYSVSVIIPTYNRVRTLPRALDSVLAQTRAIDEIIVVDDGSTDSTVDLVLGNYPQVKLLQQSNLGVSAARNHGIKEASSDWIALLDSDDRWLPTKLEAQFALVKQRPDHRLCHTEEIWIRNGKRVNQMHKHRKSGGHIYNQCLPLCVISPSSVLMHRTLFEEIGLFDETLPACEDYDLWLRVCAREPVLFVDTPLIEKYGGHDDQLSRKHWGMDRFRIRALEKILANNLLTPDQGRETVAMLLRKAAILEQGARKRGKLQRADYYRQLMQRYAGEPSSEQEGRLPINGLESA